VDTLPDLPVLGAPTSTEPVEAEGLEAVPEEG
jgi:hypothetical protein